MKNDGLDDGSSIWRINKKVFSADFSFIGNTYIVILKRLFQNDNNKKTLDRKGR